MNAASRSRSPGAWRRRASSTYRRCVPSRPRSSPSTRRSSRGSRGSGSPPGTAGRIRSSARDRTIGEDPNRAIVDSLSESERDAYIEVLHGVFDESAFGEVDPETGEPAFPDEPFGGGCQGQAYEEVYGAQEEMWEKLGPELQELWQRVQADPRFKEADREWVECMADRGYSYDGIDSLYEEVYEDFQRRLDEITGGGGFADPFEGWTEEEIDAFFEERSEEEIEDFFAQADRQEMDEIDQDALAALQQEEIDLAVAAFECQEALMDTYEELQREYEARFIRENRDILEEISS